MSAGINSLSDTSLDEFAFWALETGLWDGRPITWKEAPEFFTKVEMKLQQLLFSQNDFDFEKMAASLAWIGSKNHSRADLAREIEELRISPKGEVLTVKHKHKHKKKKSFWDKHKVSIILGVVAVAVAATVVVLTVCTGGVGGQVAATLGGAAVNGLQKALEDGTRETSSTSLPEAEQELLPSMTPEILQLSNTETNPLSSLSLQSDQEQPQPLLPWPNESMSYLQWKAEQMQQELLSALINKDQQLVPSMIPEIPQLSNTETNPLNSFSLQSHQEQPQSLLSWPNESMSYLQWKARQMQQELLSTLINKEFPTIEQNNDSFSFSEKTTSQSLTPGEIVEANERRYLACKQAIESLLTGKEIDASPKAKNYNYATSITSSEYPYSPFSEAPLLGYAHQSTIHYHCGINNSLSTVVEGGTNLREMLDEEFAIQPHLIHSNHLIGGATLVGLEKLNELDINPTLLGIAGAVLTKMPQFILEHSDIQRSVEYEVETLSRIAQNIIEQGKPNLKQLHVTFSNGGYVFNEALKRLSPEQRDTILVITTGTTAIIDANLACKVYNIIGDKDWPSQLCNGGLKNILEKFSSDILSIIKQEETDGIIGGHYFIQPDYQEKIKALIKRIINEYKIY